LIELKGLHSATAPELTVPWPGTWSGDLVPFLLSHICLRIRADPTLFRYFLAPISFGATLKFGVHARDIGVSGPLLNKRMTLALLYTLVSTYQKWWTYAWVDFRSVRNSSWTQESSNFIVQDLTLSDNLIVQSFNPDADQADLRT